MPFPIAECVTIEGHFESQDAPGEGRIVEVTGNAETANINTGFYHFRPRRIGRGFGTGRDARLGVDGLRLLEEWGFNADGQIGGIVVTYTALEISFDRLETVTSDHRVELRFHTPNAELIHVPVNIPHVQIFGMTSGGTVFPSPADTSVGADVMRLTGLSAPATLQVVVGPRAFHAPDLRSVDNLILGLYHAEDLEFPSLESCGTDNIPNMDNPQLPQCEIDAVTAACAGMGWNDCD